MKRISKEQCYDYFILAAKLWLGYTLANYGWVKLTGAQFGISQQEMNMPVKALAVFKLSWYLADHQPFKTFIGVSQIIAGLLLVFKRTTILGALISIPIWLNILVWDMSFLGLFSPFTFRLSYYIILTFLILWYERERLIPAVQMMLRKSESTFKNALGSWLMLLLALICVGAVELLLFCSKSLLSNDFGLILPVSFVKIMTIHPILSPTKPLIQYLCSQQLPMHPHVLFCRC